MFMSRFCRPVRTLARPGLLCLLLGCSLAWAQTAAVDAPAAAPAYPAQPIRLVLPSPAGGATDVWARVIAERLGQVLGQKVLVDNRPGAGGTLAAELVAHAPADGYTLLAGDVGTYALYPQLYRKLAYDPVRDFTPVTLTARQLLVLAVPRESALASVPALLAQARERPGALRYGSPSVGSPHHLAMELLQQRAGIQLTHRPYRAGAQLTADMLAGQLDLAFLDLPSALPHLRSGWLRGLAIVAPQRLPYLPELPTLEESGLAGFEAQVWQGLVVPAGTPAAVVSRLNAAYAQVCAEPAVQRRLAMIGIELTPGSPQAFRDYQQAEATRWGQLIRALDLRLD
jgi:tripartite-type tricarboxylate transporter receptor subunit TctC